MTVLVPKWTNKLPAMLALGAAATGLFVVFVVSFWFSKKSTEARNSTGKGSMESCRNGFRR